MSAKTIGYAALSIALIGLLGFGKYKLATLPAVGWVLIVGGLVFVASTPAQAE